MHRLLHQLRVLRLHLRRVVEVDRHQLLQLSSRGAALRLHHTQPLLVDSILREGLPLALAQVFFFLQRNSLDLVD